MRKPLYVTHFLIFILSIQLLALSACHRSPQVVPNPGNTDISGNPDSVIKYTKVISGTYYFEGAKHDFGNGDDTLYNISFRIKVVPLNDTCVVFQHVDTFFAPMPIDTLVYLRSNETNTVNYIASYKVTYAEYRDTLKYNFITKQLRYNSYQMDHGYGSSINSHSL